MRIDRIDFYAPHPEPGAELSCLVRFTEVNEIDARGNVDLVRDGVVWARLTQFIDRRFESTNAVFKVMTFPEENLLAERRDGFWIVHEPWRSSASRDLVARRYLGEEERAEYFALTPKAQRDWMLGRIAVKDAVRDLLWQRGHGPIFPLEVRVRNDEGGRPLVTVPGGGDMTVSLSHRTGVAVASIAEAGPAGVDLEARAWTAMEAVAKADGTGLQGRPMDFVVRQVDDDWTLVNDRWVHTTQEGDLIVSTVRER